MAGLRLDRWFKQTYPAIPHAKLEKFLRTGDIRIDGVKVKGNVRLEEGQELKLPPETVLNASGREDNIKPVRKPETSAHDLKEFKKWILFENGEMLVINKPHGLAVQGGTGVKKHVDGILQTLAPKDTTYHIVHRLDRDTSGVLLVAKTHAMARYLGEQFKGRLVEKTYWALVEGCPDPRAGTIKAPIMKMPVKTGEKMVVNAKGQSAVTDYEVVEGLSKTFAWVELSPKTGRTHQLRVHLSYMEHPIVGDGKYGWRSRVGIPISSANQRKMHLHARAITVTFSNGKKRTFTADLPSHMYETWCSLGLEVQKHGAKKN